LGHAEGKKVTRGHCQRGARRTTTTTAGNECNTNDRQRCRSARGRCQRGAVVLLYARRRAPLPPGCKRQCARAPPADGAPPRAAADGVGRASPPPQRHWRRRSVEACGRQRHWLRWGMAAHCVAGAAAEEPRGGPWQPPRGLAEKMATAPSRAPCWSLCQGRLIDGRAPLGRPRGRAPLLAPLPTGRQRHLPLLRAATSRAMDGARWPEVGTTSTADWSNAILVQEFGHIGRQTGLARARPARDCVRAPHHCEPTEGAVASVPNESNRHHSQCGISTCVSVKDRKQWEQSRTIEEISSMMHLWNVLDVSFIISV